MDYYHLYTAKEYPQYLYSTCFVAGWESTDEMGTILAEYRKQMLNGKYSQYPNLQDRINLSVPDEHLLLKYSWNKGKLRLSPHLRLGNDLGYGLDATLYQKIASYFVQLSTKESSASLTYNIRSENGSIPFAWTTARTAFGVSSPRFDASIHAASISPVHCDSLFANNIRSNSIGAALSYRLQNHWQANMSTTYSDTDADLKYKDGHYGMIQNFRVLTVNSSLQKGFSHIDYRLDLDAYFAGIGSDSYLEIWPFTYLDIFLAHRTRIKQLGIQAVVPGFEATYKSASIQNQGFSWQCGVGYHHLFHREDVIIRNRRVVLYPFIFAYDTNEYNWQDDVNGYFHIPLQASYQLKHGTIELNIQQIAPLRWSNLFKQAPTPSEPTEGETKSQWGGLSCKLSLIIPL